MAYVLEYTVVAKGATQVVEAVDHATAVARFISKPVMSFGYDRGRYEAEDGEQITVVGPTQEDYRAYNSHKSHLRLLREDVARGGKGIRERKARLARAEAQEPPSPPSNVIKTFTLRARTVFDVLSEDYLEREARIPEVRAEVEALAAEAQEIRLLVTHARQHPSDKALRGIPQSFVDEGVWMNNKLIPWIDITGAEIPEQEGVAA